MAAAERLPSPSLPESPVVPSGAPLPLGLSVELPSRPLRSPCAPALSLFVCLACFASVHSAPFLSVGSQLGLFGSTLAIFLSLPFFLTLYLRRLPQFGARPLLCPKS